MRIRKVESVESKAVEVEGAKGCRVRLLIHKAEGAPNFYMRQFILARGGCTPQHSHEWEHEIYVVSGAGMAVTPEGVNPISAGDCVYVAPDDVHQFLNTGQGELKFLCLVPATAK